MYKHIMVPLDGSKLAEVVLPHVISIAKGCAVPKVTLVRVVAPLKFYGSETELPFMDTASLEETSMKVAGDYLKEQAQKLKDEGIDVNHKVMFGIPTDSLLDYAHANGVDLVVIATHGRSGVSRWVWGSVADRILRGAKIPVLMIRSLGTGTNTV
ncbi:MAG: universal stress protein [Dehalococcoidales bacterium]|nr:universal stress protein [Dehalococcoidales bacterium]